MALTECPDCGGNVSTEAKACPHCGRPNKTPPPPEVSLRPPKVRSSGTNVGCLVLLGGAALLVYLANIPKDHSRQTKPYTPVTSTQASLPAYKLMGTQGMIRLVVMPLDLAKDRDAFLRVGHHLCSDQRVCAVLFWIDEAKAPRTLPMTDAQVAAQVASYNLNKNTGLDGFTCHPFGDPAERCNS